MTSESPSSRSILIVLSTKRYNPSVLEKSIKEADEIRASGRMPVLTVLYIREPDHLRRADDTLRTKGFLGTAARERVMDALEGEQLTMAAELCESTCEMIREAGHEVSSIETTGDYAKAVVEYAEMQRYDVIYVVRASRYPWSAMLHDSEEEVMVRYART